MTAVMDRRLSRPEDRSPWGSASEVAASPVIVMRVPPAAHASNRLLEAEEGARADRQVLKITSPRMPTICLCGVLCPSSAFLTPCSMSS